MSGVGGVGGKPTRADVGTLIFTKMDGSSHPSRESVGGSSEREGAAIFHFLGEGKTVVTCQTKGAADMNITRRPKW